MSCSQIIMIEMMKQNIRDFVLPYSNCNADYVVAHTDQAGESDGKMIGAKSRLTDQVP